jgi:hypothetical protein
MLQSTLALRCVPEICGQQYKMTCIHKMHVWMPGKAQDFYGWRPLLYKVVL